MFMSPDLTGKMDWHEIDGHDGTIYYPADYFSLYEAEVAYGEDGILESRTVSGYGARLSAAGYMDCTDWIVCDDPIESLLILSQMFGDDDELQDAIDAIAEQIGAE